MEKTCVLLQLTMRMKKLRMKLKTIIEVSLTNHNSHSELQTLSYQFMSVAMCECLLVYDQWILCMLGKQRI